VYSNNASSQNYEQINETT